jgi:hypothetical protein
MMDEKRTTDLGPNQLLRLAAGYDPGEEPMSLSPRDDQPPSPPRDAQGRFVDMDELLRAAVRGSDEPASPPQGSDMGEELRERAYQLAKEAIGLAYE